MLTRRDALSLGLAAAGVGVAGAVSAQPTPAGRQTLRVLVGFPPGGTYSMNQAAFKALVKADLERWGPIVKATGYTAED
jgi:tripartite-type tricarboxylate transporter receptor subunit TctC